MGCVTRVRSPLSPSGRPSFRTFNACLGTLSSLGPMLCSEQLCSGSTHKVMRDAFWMELTGCDCVTATTKKLFQ